MIRLSHIASMVSEVTGADLETVYVRCKHFLADGRISHSGQIGRSKLFTERELFRTIVLSVALDAGLNGAALIEVAAALDENMPPPLVHPESASVGNGYQYGIAIDALVRGIRAGEEWVLRYHRAYESDGGIITRVSVSPPNNSAGWRGYNALNIAYSEIPIVNAEIPIHRYLSAVLKILEQDA